ncbi:MAG TPA: DNA mismatch repair protein [Polyangiaceae bacterium]|nr:DNA mismatch repair protein [Polyangiaceae bacterium]
MVAARVVGSPLSKTSGELRAEPPDLLHAAPFPRFDAEALRLSLTLAFSGGGQGGLFGEALDRAVLAPSSFDPGAFASDLFLRNFVGLCCKVRVGQRDYPVAHQHLARLIASPPSDPRTIEFRRAILAELATSRQLREELEQLYVVLYRLRKILESGSAEWDPNRRQMDILAAVKELVERMADKFCAARSGLSRLAEFGARVKASEAFRSLADLIAYDEKLATLELKVSVGADGKIRAFKLLSVAENQTNPFVGSPAQRWLARAELFLRGFSFSSGEVMARLILAVFDGLEPVFPSFVGLLGDLEFYLGALGFKDFAASAGLPVCLPEFVTAETPRVLDGLFNPLLLAHGIPPVPCDLTTDRHDTTVLVTGPNSGGKTRLLQSVALAQLLGQAGLFVPARVAKLTLASSLVVSLIQETKADQAEGRLGMELVRIRALFEHLPPGAMVMLDELCSGTNPSEGEEIFELVVQMLTRLRPQAFITTHFLAFASRLESAGAIPELRFLQVSLGENHEPTYQFKPGVAKTSLAGHAAARLGVTGEQLLALVERNTRALAAKREV